MPLKTRTMNIEVYENHYDELKSFAESQGEGVTDFIKEAIRERLEYLDDLKDIEEYEQEKANGTLVTTPWNEIKERLKL